MAEERTRIHTRIIPETEHKIAAAMPPSNCQTQNEFVKKALRFYCDYTSPRAAFPSCRPCSSRQSGPMKGTPPVIGGVRNV